MMMGKTLGHYQVLDKLGAGGMGEVYRARDTRLNRDVALKFLPAAFANDRERLARFEREAQLLAALNHPNIAVIHGLEESDGARFLVLEYVPGENLSGPLPPEEALLIAHQVIDALEEAHEKGIVHRDLKPANIKITPEGKLKVLDFGLAKALVGDPIDEVASNSPTLAATALTRGAVLLGTAAYMSPEQARGKKVDKRADIFAFGSVLYEVLTGKQAFGGDTISDSLAAILTKEPDRSLLPASTPANLRRLLDRCLEKDLKRRLRDIGEARILLEEAPVEAAPAAPAVEASKRAPWGQWVPWAIAALAVVGAGLATWAWWRVPRPAPRPVVRLSTTLPQASRYPWVALARDGSRLAFLAGSPPRIYLRLMDQLDAKPIAGTEGALAPFFSPDGQWVGFFQAGKWKKIQVIGGATITLCDTTGPEGATWGTDGTIIFGTSGKGLSKVSAAGGKPQVLTTPDPKKGETAHRWPELFPGGQGVVFTIGAGGSYDDAKIAMLSLNTGEQRVVVEGGTFGRYVPTGPPGSNTGHIVYWRTGSLFAVPFSLRMLQVTGSPVPIQEGVLGVAGQGWADFSFSETGALAYSPGSSEELGGTLVWVDRQGQAKPLPAPSRQYREMRLSPDGQRVAIRIGYGGNSDIWVYDLARGTLTRLTFQGDNLTPLWTPDGKRVTFLSREAGKNSVSWILADGSGAAESLAPADSAGGLTSWSPDGKLLAFTQGFGVQRDIWLLPAPGAPGDRKPQAFLQTQFGEYGAEFSPDGRWIAYVSTESSRPEVYVRPAPSAAGPAGAGGKWQVSTEGGTSPRWARSGRELFYRSRGRTMVVEIDPGAVFRSGTPKLLFSYGDPLTTYDVSPDGKRFLMPKSGAEGEGAATQVHIVLEWFEEIRRRVRAGA